MLFSNGLIPVQQLVAQVCRIAGQLSLADVLQCLLIQLHLHCKEIYRYVASLKIIRIKYQH
jgi:hypothetical protein